jgi:hypothetical protein
VETRQYWAKEILMCLVVLEYVNGSIFVPPDGEASLKIEIEPKVWLAEAMGPLLAPTSPSLAANRGVPLIRYVRDHLRATTKIDICAKTEFERDVLRATTEPDLYETTVSHLLAGNEIGRDNPDFSGDDGGLQDNEKRRCWRERRGESI